MCAIVLGQAGTPRRAHTRGSQGCGTGTEYWEPSTEGIAGCRAGKGCVRVKSGFCDPGACKHHLPHCTWCRAEQDGQCAVGDHPPCGNALAQGVQPLLERRNSRFRVHSCTRNAAQGTASLAAVRCLTASQSSTALGSRAGAGVATSVLTCHLRCTLAGSVKFAQWIVPLYARWPCCFCCFCASSSSSRSSSRSRSSVETRRNELRYVPPTTRTKNPPNAQFGKRGLGLFKVIRRASIVIVRHDHKSMASSKA